LTHIETRGFGNSFQETPLEIPYLITEGHQFNPIFARKSQIFAGYLHVK
jgi:hypothetical protein